MTLSIGLNQSLAHLFPETSSRKAEQEPKSSVIKQSFLLLTTLSTEPNLRRTLIE